MVIKEQLLKEVINDFTRVMVTALPEANATQPATKALAEVYRRLRLSAKDEPQRFYADKNYPRLLKVTENALIYLAEHDTHYRGVLSYAMFAVYDIVKELRERYPQGHQGDIEFLEWFAQQTVLSSREVE